ncbi:MAG TPA: hypothetical protein VIO36_10505 [Anaerolineaceae bacterium]
MEGPANTLAYMIAGYAIIFTVLAVYLVSLVVRWRNLRQDEETLREIEKKR